MATTMRVAARVAGWILAGLLVSCGGGGDPATNQPPVATIASPAGGTTFRAGDRIDYAGSATDPEDGGLAATRLTWWAELHHDTHSHPFLPETTGASGSVTIPTQGETSPNIFYRFHLRATDSAGATHEVTRDIQPQTAQVTVTSSPAGLALTVDGQPVTGPDTFTGVVGIERSLGAVAQQTLNGRRYQFVGWSDAGAATHTIATPAANTTYTATYQDVGPVTNTPPTVALSAPANNSTGTVGVPITVTATAADAGGSVASVRFQANGTNIDPLDTAAPYSVAWTPAAAGTYTLRAIATDNEGAQTTSATVTVTINAAALGATLTAPTALQTGITGALSLTATVTGSATGVEFQVDGTPVGTDTTAPYAFSLDTTAYASGQHVVRARALAAGGATSAWSSATVEFGGGRTQPAGFTRNTAWITGLSSATAFAQAPDGRLFVAQQGGQLRVVKNGALLPTAFITLNVDSNGERGLLGVAFHPEFATNAAKRFVYLYYTVPGTAAHNRISRFTQSPTNPDTVSVGSEVFIADLPNLSSATNHNGGALHFGTDGKLYVAVGDNANSAKAPDLNDPFGKILRFDVDAVNGNYIPADNPFCTTAATLRCAIWARGLRNPFTFSVRAGDGRMHINDVGQNTWEEINVGAAGANYGWPATEGPTSAAGVTAPIYAYDHTDGPAAGDFFSGCAITGGAFYPAAGAFPAAYRDSYYFADYCGNWIARLDAANGNVAYAFASLGDAPVDMLVGADAALYVLTRGGITRISAP